MTRNTSLSIIVPVFNEQFLIQASLSRLRSLGRILLAEPNQNCGGG